jgi:hypothetical protein
MNLPDRRRRSPCTTEKLRPGRPTGLAFIAMMQAAQHGHRDDLALTQTLHGSRFRGILVQAQVRATPVVEMQSTIPHNMR